MTTSGPDWAVPPGEVLLELLAERGMTMTDLARAMGRDVPQVSRICSAKTSITPHTAIQLEEALGVAAEVWLNLDSQYRLRRARAEAAGA